MLKLILKRGALALLAVLLLLQLIPYGRDHANPKVQAEPAWDSPETRNLAARACFDCHSNETKWPWYSNVAPLSWPIQDHVEEGREKLNFSAWAQPQKEAHEAAEKTAEGDMPPADYLLLHADARLSAGETAALVKGLEATLGGERRTSRRDDDD